MNDSKLFIVLYTFRVSIKNNSGLNVFYCQWCGLFFTFSPVLFFMLWSSLVLYTNSLLPVLMPAPAIRPADPSSPGELEPLPMKPLPYGRPIRQVL